MKKITFLILAVLCLTSLEIYSSQQKLKFDASPRATHKTETLEVIMDLLVVEINAGILKERLLV